MKPHVFLFLLLLIYQSTIAETYYVAPNGNDQNAGSLRKPFASLTHARDAVRAARKPSTILLRGGTYFLNETLILSREDSNVTFAAYKYETPIISGGQRIVNWKTEKNFWTAELPDVHEGKWNFRQLFANGERRFRPRFPHEGVYRVAELLDGGVNVPLETPTVRFRFADQDIRSSWANLTDAEVVVLTLWVDVHLPIASLDDASRTVTFTRKSRRKVADDHSNRGARYYVDNVFEALREGEFYLNRKTGILTYWPKPNEKIANTEIIAPRLTNLIRIEGDPKAGKFVENIAFRGITFAHSKYELPPDEAGDTQAAFTVAGALFATGAKNLSIQNCTFRNLGGYGIELTAGCSGAQIIGNEITDCGAGGIKLTGGKSDSAETERTHHNTITDNHLHHLGEIYHSAVGILSRHSAANTIAYNHIHHLYYTGISVGWVWGYSPSVSRDNRIEFNHIHDIGRGLLSDMGGIYTLGQQPGSTIRNNLIHDVESYGYGGWGIYPDEGSSEILIENNVTSRAKTGGFHQHYGRDNIVRNNIFAFSKENQIARSRHENHNSFTFERNIVYWNEGPLWKGGYSDKFGEGYKLDHNLYWDASGKLVTFGKFSLDDWRKKGHDIHSLIADPLFVAPDKGDFRLQKNSPAIQIGFKPIDLRAVGPRKSSRSTRNNF